MRKITLNLAAYTRIEFSKEIEVPDDTTDEELEMMLHEFQDSTDGGEYVDDPDYWEQGEPYWTEN